MSLLHARVAIDEIWSYIAGNSVAAADRTLDRFHELFRMLARQPLIGELCSDIRADLRNFPAGN